MRNIQIVDDIVKRTEKLVNEFYQDQDTSFVFTADHGMSEIGNHGDGREFLIVYARPAGNSFLIWPSDVMQIPIILVHP